MSTSQRKSITTPAPGLLVYDIDKKTIFLFDGTQWLPMMVATNGTNTIPETIIPTQVQEQAGSSVDVSGNYAIVGARTADQNRGAAYIYFKQNGTWTQQAKLTASDAAIDDIFGYSVAINGDWAVVGAPYDDILSGPPIIINHTDRGSIYIFQRNGTTWTQTAKLTSTTVASQINYGISVAMDGDRLIVGAYIDNDNGAAYIYQRSGNLWALQQRIFATDGAFADRFGGSVDIHGNYAIVGAVNADNSGNSSVGAAYIFFNNGITWSMQQKVGGSDLTDNYGIAVAITDTLALVGSSNTQVNSLGQHGIVVAYRRNTTTWSNIGTLDVPDGIATAAIGSSIAIDGELAIVGAPNGFGTFAGQGTCYVYQYIDRDWRYQHKINESQGMAGAFGFSVATDGLHIIIGNPNRGGSIGAGGVAIVSCD